MHLLIPFAAPLSEAGRQALRSLQLPHLQAVLAQMQPQTAGLDEGDEWTLSPPHERALARALGWQGAAGQLPWAARLAQADCVDVGELAWGLMTPAHWHLGTDQVSLLDPEDLMLDAEDSRALFEAVRPLLAEEGTLAAWGAPLRWYLAHEGLAQLPCASLDRVVGRNVDAWLGSDPLARRLRRLQSEVQMLLYTHPVNAAREQRGLLAVNSFWLSGCGVRQPEAGPAAQVDDRLRRPALRDDWAAWTRAWQTLDDGPLAEFARLLQRGGAASQALGLTLCGERSALSLQPAAGGWWPRLRARWSPKAPHTVLEAL